MSEKLPVAVLAATGSVGQRFIHLLDGHPMFRVVALTGSEKRVGKKFGESCHWILDSQMPNWAREMMIQPSDPNVLGVPLVFSALPKSYAYEIEPMFARAGVGVCTNAGAFRPDEDVPILLPEINADHIHLIRKQRSERGWSGFIATNPNCTSTGMTIALKALDDAFGVEKVFAVTMQAVSGAGYPGVSSLDILGNVVPYIGGEEEKVEWEPRKMMGRVDESGGLILHGMKISTHTNRVAVRDGHLVCISVGFKTPPSPRDAVQVLENYLPPEEVRGLPSTPEPVIQVRHEPDRPQPLLDRMTGNGMTTVVGRVREDPLLDLKMIVLSHNTIRGAAGGSIYNAELLLKTGLVG